MRVNPLDTALGAMTVVDISQQLPGPYTGSLLASMGATVIKIEPPGGDPARLIDPEMYELVNRGKSLRTLDLKTAEGVRALHELIGTADVFVEGFRPGVTDRLGASWTTLSRIRPQLVYCSITGMGQKGPYATVPVHDMNLRGMAGLPPEVGIGVPWVDVGTSTTAALAIVAVWSLVRESGKGVFLDCAMLDTACTWAKLKASVRGRVEPSYGVFESADGRQVGVAVLEDHMWRRLCAALEWDDWLHGGDLGTYAARVAASEEVHRRLAGACRARTSGELLRLAVQFDLPITPWASSGDDGVSQQVRLRRLEGAKGRSVAIPVGEVGGADA